MPRKLRLYIDVDGVLLKPAFANGGPPVQTTADDLGEFLDWAVETFDCYWLTAWGIGGDGKNIRRALIPHLPPAAKRIKLAVWHRLKTDAFKDGEFFWIDDELYAGERELLSERGWITRYVRVDPFERSLLPVRKAIESRMKRVERETKARRREP